MSAANRIAPVPGARRPLPPQARRLAARLSAMFEQDCRIVGRQADAQRRLMHANERLWPGLGGDTLALVHDGAATAGDSRIAGLSGVSDATGPASRSGVLEALREAHWAIRRAFHAYQDAGEERRQLAAEVGETVREFVDALLAAGWSEDEARKANVHQLAVGGPTVERGTGR